MSFMAQNTLSCGAQLEDEESSIDGWKIDQFNGAIELNESFKGHPNLGNQEEEKESSRRIPQTRHRVKPHAAGMDPLTCMVTGICYDAAKFMASLTLSP